MTDSVKWRGPRLPATPLQLTLEQAAGRQVEAAIDALERGDFDVALTLAGAAEGMIKRDVGTMFTWLRDHPGATQRFAAKKEWINLLNRELYWLKHGGEDAMEIDCATAAFMIARAATNLAVWTPKIERYRDWLMNHFEII